MFDRHAMARVSWGKYLVLAVVVADCIGIYFANARLNQAPVEPLSEPAGEAVAQPDRPPVNPADGAMPQPDFAAGDSLPKSVSKPVAEAELPAFMPLPSIAKEETATFIPSVELATIEPEFRRPRMAKLQPSRKSSHRFTSAFATDIVNPAALDSAAPSFGSNTGAPDAFQEPQAGAADAGQASDPIGAPEYGQAKAPAAIMPEAQAPEAGDAPMAELPAVEADTGAELPAG